MACKVIEQCIGWNLCNAWFHHGGIHVLCRGVTTSWKVRRAEGHSIEILSRLAERAGGGVTGPCETPKNKAGEKINYFHILHGKDERTDKIGTMSRTVPVIPNHEERRDNKMLWSIVPYAAERRRRQRQDTMFLRACDIGEVVMDIQKSCLSGVAITERRLVRI